MTLTHAQAAAAYADASVAVTAGAGTGKTHMLAERYLHHLRAHGLGPLEIVAVTFTERAAAELRSRIRARVIAELPDAAQHHAELEAATIGTIHGLASRICREHPEAAGVAPDFQILDEQEGAIWATERLDEVVAQLPPELFGELPYDLVRAALVAMLADPLIAERALAQPLDGLEALAQGERERAIDAWLDEPAVCEAYEVACRCGGTAGDRIEDARATVVGAIALLRANSAAGEVPVRAIADLCGIDLRGGSKNNWPNGDLVDARVALKVLRESGREARDAGLVLLQVGPKDEQMKRLVPLLATAFEGARQHLAEAKLNARVLDFADLEIGALRALSHGEVRAYYAERWKAFLVDEFQDTNPIQAEILGHLTPGTRLTVVGDEQQSIYGFRRADVAVFQRFQAQIADHGGQTERLSLSYRMHTSLVETVDGIFAPVLGPLHKPLKAARASEPHAGPHVRYLYIDAGEADINKPQRQRAEARRIAREIKGMLDSGTTVHDKASGELRPMRPGDVAVLSRVWAPLELYGEALAHEGIAAVHAGGGDLMGTREALDGWALLQFLADPADNLALASVLRGPWFAVSDRTLFVLARGLANGVTWWGAIGTSTAPEFARPREVLEALLRARATESPTRLLQLADRRCGLTAVLANLPGAGRRLSDWRGFMGLVRQLEQGACDVFQVIRRLRRLLAAEVEFPRPSLEAGDAVALMTVHAAKGLEWPVVVVPDLTRAARHETRVLHMDATLGIGLWLPGDDADTTTQPVRYTVLAERQARLEEEERKRVAYVALTRARDHLLLTATSAEGGSYDFLAVGLAAALVVPEAVLYDPADAVPPTLPTPLPPAASRLALLDAVGSGVVELPVTALGEYESCPRRFRYRYIDGHPGLVEGGSGGGFAARVGTLTHTALELGLVTPAELAKEDATLPEEQVAEAAELARRFREKPAFAAFHADTLQREQTFKLPLGRLMLSGAIDAVGPGYVLDFKTDREMEPADHLLQIWVYATHTGSPVAHLAYLRHGHVHTFGAEELAATRVKALAVAEGIADGRYGPTPSPNACGTCPFPAVCDAQCLEVPTAAASAFLRGVNSLEELDDEPGTAEFDILIMEESN